MARILVCDDAAFMRLTLKKILEPAGHQIVAEAANGEECIQRFKEYRPEIVLMDITMPDMDGIEATKLIKEIDKDVTIIMVSAMGQQAKVFEAFTAGAKDFIVKPFESEKILECVNKYI
jgi:two-component system chemotaxis response regulator CheY